MPLTVEEDTDSAPAIGLPARPGLEGAPAATYRLQFNSDFTLAHARELVPYLYELGISHIYASPLLRAVRGSRHGYDICDFNELNPEVGTPEDFARQAEAASGAGEKKADGNVVDAEFEVVDEDKKK